MVSVEMQRHARLAGKYTGRTRVERKGGESEPRSDEGPYHQIYGLLNYTRNGLIAD
jgi:hypothetical protein